MKIVLHGGIGDRVAFTATLREFKKRRPAEEVTIFEPKAVDMDIFRHNPNLNWGSVESGERIHLKPLKREAWASLPHYYAEQMGFELVDDTPEIFLTREERGRDFGLPVGGRRTVAIDPWCTPAWRSRRWPHARWVELVRRLRAAGWCTVEIGKRPEMDPEAEAAPPLGADLHRADRYELRDSLSIISQADLVVSSDTGAMHMAAAVGTPQVTLFSVVRPVDRAYWNTTAVSPYSDCAKSCLMDCTRWDPLNKGQAARCIDEISVDRVLEACEVAWKRWGGAARPGRPEAPRRPQEVYAALMAEEFQA